MSSTPSPSAVAGLLHRGTDRDQRGPGLAFGAGVPMIGVSTLAAMARAHKLEGAEQVLAAIDARMDEVYFGHYALVDG
jgi:hypothetical protein